MDNTIEIPIRNSEEVIELECSNLPEPDEVLQILIQEKAQMKIWIRLALEYWRQDRKPEFQQILEAARTDAGVDYIGRAWTVQKRNLRFFSKFNQNNIR